MPRAHALEPTTRRKHLVVPAAHGVSGRYFDKVGRRFMHRASVAGLPVAGTRKIDLPPFVPHE